MLDNGSLTQRLKDASDNDFKVKLCFQGYKKPSLAEISSIEAASVKPVRSAQQDVRPEFCIRHSGLALHAFFGRQSVCLIREVELVCDGEVWVRARSAIPIATLTGPERQLKNLGTKPLGEFLFNSRSMRRSPLVPFCQIEQKEKYYGRRSVFYLHEKPILVSELFLPRLFKRSGQYPTVS